MSKITVNETVTRSVSFENNLVDVQTALDRCFQFLEEERFDEAHVIIEQILDIDPNNTDAHIANFLYQFRCGRIDWLDYNRYNDYQGSVFYSRIYSSTQTLLRTQFISRISELQRAFENETERRHKEEEDQRKKKEFDDNVMCCVMFPFLTVFGAFSTFFAFVEKLYWVAVLLCLPLTIAWLCGFCVSARKLYYAIKEKHQKQLDQQKTEQAAD